MSSSVWVAGGKGWSKEPNPRSIIIPLVIDGYEDS